MITASRLRYLISYNRASGQLRWKNPTSPRTRVGDIAGSINKDGLCIIQIARRKFCAHRIAVLHVTGKHPEGRVGFKNGDRADTRWRNLRVA
jgi:hypothetical protein